jgi:hypothetical protein
MLEIERHVRGLVADDVDNQVNRRGTGWLDAG